MKYNEKLSKEISSAIRRVLTDKEVGEVAKRLGYSQSYATNIIRGFFPIKNDSTRNLMNEVIREAVRMANSTGKTLTNY
jgi:FAD synthase